MRKFLVSLAAVALLVPMFSLAADIRGGEVVSKDEKPNNLYTAGQNPTVDADVTGDLVIAGNTVTMNGSVSGGVLAAGSILTLNGNVSQSVRVAGGTVTINGAVGGDLVVFGGDVLLGSQAIVSGDVLVFAGTLNLQGDVQGSVKSSFVGDVIVSGGVAGNLELKNASTIKIESSAIIGGALKYSSQDEATVATDAKVGAVEYTKTSTNNNEQSLGNRLGNSLFTALIMLVTLLVFIRLFPNFSKDIVNSSVTNPWMKLGVGLVGMIITPIILLILAFTVFGWGVMGFLGLAYAGVLALTSVMVSLLAGSFVWKYIRKTPELVVNWQAAIIGIVLVGAVKLIPIVGWLLSFALAALSFGALTMKGFEYIKAQRAVTSK